MEVELESRAAAWSQLLTPIRLLGAGARVALALIIVPFRATDGAADD